MMRWAWMPTVITQIAWFASGYVYERGDHTGAVLLALVGAGALTVAIEAVVCYRR